MTEMDGREQSIREDFFIILEGLHIMIKKTLDAGQNDETMRLLEQCQKYAVDFGRQIEAEEGGDVTGISPIEHYCKLVYHIYEKIIHVSNITGNEAYNLLAKDLIKIRKNICRRK